VNLLQISGVMPWISMVMNMRLVPFSG